MPPPARDEQLQSDRAHAALAAATLGEVDERAADPDAALVGRGDEDPELAGQSATWRTRSFR